MKMDNQIVFSVTEITRRIKSVLESEFVEIAVEGELSNVKLHSSGHLYFTLKDENAQLSGVMWRNRVNYLPFTPQDGMKVIAIGRITVYEVQGKYQLDAVHLKPLGVGELQLAFERLKRKLAEEGLFDEANKKPIPQYPQRIGIVTSPTGAVIQDIANIISRRFPAVELILYPVKVQGAGAANEIVCAIRDFNRWKIADVLIVGRGGGSLEDLWPFNEEIVARAIYASEIPIISAVGHEIDYTISDFVADLRAPTPSAAAELVVPEKTEFLENMMNFCYTAKRILQQMISNEKKRIHSILQSYALNRPVDLIKQYYQRLDGLENNIKRLIKYKFAMYNNTLNGLSQRIYALNPELVLKRGYTIIQKDSGIISRKEYLSENDKVKIKFYDGPVTAEILSKTS